MIKASTKVGVTTIQVEADNVKDLIKELSFFNELPSQCGKCGGRDIGFSHRTVDKFEYYELVCNDKNCEHTLALGQHQNGETLFPNFTKGWQPPFRKAAN